MNEKKVIAVIVEGPSDENAIGGILKEFFSSDRKSTRLNSSHPRLSRMPSSA